MTELQSRKTKLHDIQLVETSIPKISDGEICLKVDRFAFTSNNITYGVAGDMLGYWQFFPPQTSSSEGWGLLPVWGFADVIKSKSDGIPVGDRIFGYFPPATHTKMKPVKITNSGFIEGAEHRSQLPPAYNRYSRVAGEPSYNADMDDMRMLLFPLHITSFCLHDYLADNNWFGAKQVLIVSASSKTSLGLAYGLYNDDSAPANIGITSARNLEFVNSLGYYDDAFTYDHIESLKNVPTAIVDMSGNTDVAQKIRARLGENMKQWISVGITHWEDRDPASAPSQDDRTAMFFAPSHIQKRMKDWGPAEFQKRSMGFMMKSIGASQAWLKVKEVDGISGLADIYQNVCDGRIPANEGVIVKV